MSKESVMHVGRDVHYAFEGQMRDKRICKGWVYAWDYPDVVKVKKTYTAELWSGMNKPADIVLYTFEKELVTCPDCKKQMVKVKRG